jgi:transcriptional regulator with XRE-family HTH domain
MTVASRIRTARLAAGLTQRQLAAETGLAVSTVSRIERGHVLPSLASLERMATAMQTTVSRLTQETGHDH